MALAEVPVPEMVAVLAPVRAAAPETAPAGQREMAAARPRAQAPVQAQVLVAAPVAQREMVAARPRVQVPVQAPAPVVAPVAQREMVAARPRVQALVQVPAAAPVAQQEMVAAQVPAPDPVLVPAVAAVQATEEAPLIRLPAQFAAAPIAVSATVAPTTETRAEIRLHPRVKGELPARALNAERLPANFVEASA